MERHELVAKMKEVQAHMAECVSHAEKAVKGLNELGEVSWLQMRDVLGDNASAVNAFLLLTDVVNAANTASERDNLDGKVRVVDWALDGRKT